MNDWRRLLVVVAILPAPFAGAAETSVQRESGGDLYAAGVSVQVLQPVAGDAVLAGGSVLVTENIAEDVLAAGGSVTITGAVEDDLRAAGGTVTVTDRIGGDAIMAGGSVSLASSSTVGGNTWTAGGSIDLSGTIQGDVEAAGGEVSIRGRLNGDARVIAESLKIGPGAVIVGTLHYRGPRPATVAEGAQVGELNYTEDKFEGYGVSLVGALLAALLMFVALAVCTLIFAWLLPNVCREAAGNARSRMLLSLGVGLATVILTPVLGGVLFMLLLTTPLAIILFASYIVLLITGSFVALACLGSWVRGKFLGDREGAGSYMLSMLIAALILWVVVLVPVIGAIVVALAFITGAGSLILLASRSYRQPSTS